MNYLEEFLPFADVLYDACLAAVLLWLVYTVHQLKKREPASVLFTSPQGPMGPDGPIGPTGLQGEQGPPGPAAKCACAEALTQQKTAASPQEKRRATMAINKLIKDGTIVAPPGHKSPRVRTKRRKRKKATKI